MGDKRDKKRPGRGSPRHRKPAVEVLHLSHGVRVQIDPAAGVVVIVAADYVAQIDLMSGEIERKAEFNLSKSQRDLITSVALDTLAKRGLAPADPLDLRDALFA